MKRRHVLCLVVAVLTSASCFAGDPLGMEKGRAKDILKIVSKDIEKNFYDPQMMGLDWAALTQQARERIDRAQSVGQIYTAIFVLVDKVHNSHTMFLPPRRAVRPLFGFEAKAYGDGIYVYKLKKGGSAQAAGVQLGDQIIQLNGITAERNSFDAMMLFFRVLQPVAKMDLLIARGQEKPGVISVPAKMKVEAASLDLRNEMNLWDLIREIESDDDENRSTYIPPDKDGIAYLGLKSFDYEPDSVISLASVLSDAKGMIVDLRGNFGGRIDTLAALVGHYIKEPDTIGDEVGRTKTEPIRVKPHRGSMSVPMVILIDSQSSSSSELFARYFQRTHKATIVGDHTQGRVTASRFFSESLGTDRIVPFGVQIGVGKVVLPEGEILENKGVAPDETCLPTQEDLNLGRDNCYVVGRSILRKALGQKEVEKNGVNASKGSQP